MDIFTLNPRDISHFGETGGHNMDFCGIREGSKKLFGMYLKRRKIVFFRNNVIYIIFIHSYIIFIYSYISKIGFYRADLTPS